MNPFSKTLPQVNTFIPKIPYNTLKSENIILNPHPIYYIEDNERILLSSYPYLPSTEFLIASARHENRFQEYCYFLLFTQLKNKSHRYGLFFNPQSLSVLELKLTLYAYPHHPVEISIYHQEERVVHQFCFGHTNFNFFLSWNRCKLEDLKCSLKFISGLSYQVEFQFNDLRLV